MGKEFCRSHSLLFLLSLFLSHLLFIPPPLLHGSLHYNIVFLFCWLCILLVVLYRLYVRLYCIYHCYNCVANENTLVVDPCCRWSRRPAYYPLGYYWVHCLDGHLLGRDLAGASRCYLARQSTCAAHNSYAWRRFWAVSWWLHPGSQVRTLR